MSENTTPGEICYAAYVREHFGIYDLLATWQYARLSAVEQRAWEAAAQAVLARPPEAGPRLPRCRWCGQPVAAHPQDGPPWRCRLSDGPLLPKEPRHA